jgi:microcystin-dependent protein
MTWTNWGFDGTINEAQWSQMAGLLGNGYVAADASSCVTTAVPGARSVSVSAGTLYGDGIVSVNSAAKTVAMTTPVNGQWYLIALRRTWATNSVELVAIAGATTTTATPATVPTSYPTINSTPGVLTDQPISWAWCNSANLTVIVSDLRKTPMKQSETIPTGFIMPYAGSTAPTGWLIADGSALSRITYADLYSVIGTTYGVGNGTTTFNIPDLRTRVPAGKSAAGTFAILGASGGNETKSLAIGEMPTHTHTFSGTTSWVGSHQHNQTAGQGGGGLIASTAQGGIANASGQLTSSLTNAQGAHDHTYSGTTSSQGSGTAFSLVQPFLTVNYCVKF